MGQEAGTFVLAQERLKALSQTMQEQLEARLNQRASQIIQEITNGHYDRLLAEDHLHLVLLSKGKRVPVERVSRGTLERAYFALRNGSWRDAFRGGDAGYFR